MEKSIEKLQEIIRQKNQRINDLENQLREHGIFVVDPEKRLSAEDKVKVFMDYFRGRTDLYAERYYNRKKQSYGWNPVCSNSFAPGCPKRQGRFNCFQCSIKSFQFLAEETLKKHFTGKNYGLGIYPMLPDHTCYLLALDFDEDTWFEDMKSVYRQSVRHHLYPVMERSQSGCGGHLWFFFATAVKAKDARKLGEYLIQEAMKINKKLKFTSFDRMFPNQDYVPEGGAGNLIALPLRYDAYLNGNSALIDENEQVIQYPIEYLMSRKKVTPEEINSILSSARQRDYFFEDDQMRLALDTELKYAHELSGQITSYIRLEKINMNAVTLNILCRCASMYNPKYYELQRLHRPIYFGSGITRVLSYYEEDDKYLYLPRGLITVIQKAMPETDFHLEDKTQSGHMINVVFKGTLREHQKSAADTILKNNMGILQAAPGFGKTVIAIYLIAALKINTLILVDSKELQNQWEERIERFLDYPHAERKKDRFVCKFGSSSKKLNGNIDIAMVRSLRNAEDLADICSGYGMTIVDECHHVACDSFLHVMRHITSKYIYGLSATPKRDDGLFKVITMYCGPIQKRIGRESVREGYSFKQLLIPRYTGHYSMNKNLGYAELCSELMQDQARNYQIVSDILIEYREGNNIIVLTERVEHLSLLFSILEKSCDDVYSLSGEVKRKDRKVTLEAIRNQQKYVLLATSKLLGEGFDLPSLNCLFLVLPISSETRITQYTGRIHRSYEGKDTVKVYDYVDAQIPMAQSMYYKRLKQYEKEGYLIQMNQAEQNVTQILYEKENYKEPLFNDLIHAKREAVLFVSSLNYSRLRKYHAVLQEMAQRGVQIYYVLDSSIDPDADVVVYLKGTGGKVVVKKHNKHFVVIDGTIVWNCSFSVLGTIPKESFATRNEDAKTAQEVILSIKENTHPENDRPKLF